MPIKPSAPILQAVLVLSLLVPISAFAGSPIISGILAGSWQHANGSQSGKTSSEGEANAQLDLLIGLPMGPGSWQMAVKGGTTPRSNGISAIYPEANGS